MGKAFLLSYYSLFCQNTRGYHWNIKGDTFFELPLKFEEFYKNLPIKIGDPGTNALMSGYIREQEKRVWMYAAFLKK